MTEEKMKSIKFRAWDKEEKKMCVVREIIFRGMGRGLWTINGNNPDIYELMQSTGLRDRNGDEIYEGDIIDFGGLKPIKVIWRHCGFQSELMPYKGSNPIKLTEEGLKAFAKIIGNIYENPEGGTTIPNYDTPIKKHEMNKERYCKNCGMIAEDSGFNEGCKK